MIGWLYWNPSIKAFTVPFINHDVVWYGILFALGIFLSYFVAARLLFRVLLRLPGQEGSKENLKREAYACIDKLSLYLVISMVIFSRLFHLVFYENISYVLSDPLSLFKVWEGGLSSHGGVIGVFIGMGLFLVRERTRYPFLSFASLVDLVVIPGMLTGFFIRIGNFVNQEILGTPTKMAWGILFGASPLSQYGIALHPVMLYEAALYCIAFFVFSRFFDQWIDKRGRIAGLFFCTVFSGRFILEFFKQNQSYYAGNFQAINMGQILTLPLLLFGVSLLYQSFKPGKTLVMGNIRKQKSAKPS